MQWGEFAQLLSGISPDTALGRIASIRTETDPKVLKHFTKEQIRIRNEWRARRGKHRTVSQKELDTVLEQMKQAFISMAGGAKPRAEKKPEANTPDV